MPGFNGGERDVWVEGSMEGRDTAIGFGVKPNKRGSLRFRMRDQSGSSEAAVRVEMFGSRRVGSTETIGRRGAVKSEEIRSPAKAMFFFDQEKFDVEVESYGGRVVVTVKQKEDRPTVPPRPSAAGGSDSE